MEGVIIRPSQGKYKKLDEVETNIETTEQVSINAEVQAAINYVVETFGKAFDVKQLVEMVKGHYTAHNDKDITLNDASIEKLLLHEQGISKK